MASKALPSAPTQSISSSPSPKSPALLDKAPSKARILTKPFIVSTSSSKFGGEMIKARQGLLVRQSLEEGALVGGHHDYSPCGGLHAS
ncbi:hypothetical protein B0H14DRAFT_3446801 [Mycena olivaceomarginata]|nr:hypothetical protein B0H14DRAFT_3446801 [Mycena olivaceomarginata]